MYIQNFRCSGLPVIWKRNDDSEFDHYVNNFFKFDNLNNCQILISELAQYGDVDNYLSKLNLEGNMSEDTLSILYFQFIYTLSQIQKLIPGFIHNDCHTGNILVQRDTYFDPTSQQFYLYHYEDNYYMIPVTDFQIKFWILIFQTLWVKQIMSGNIMLRIHLVCILLSIVIMIFICLLITL